MTEVAPTRMSYEQYLAAERGEYVRVSQRRPLLEVYRKNGAGQWVLFEVRGGDSELESLGGVTLEVDAIYRNPLVG